MWEDRFIGWRVPFGIAAASFPLSLLLLYLDQDELK